MYLNCNNYKVVNNTAYKTWYFQYVKNYERVLTLLNKYARIFLVFFLTKFN